MYNDKYQVIGNQ